MEAANLYLEATKLEIAIGDQEVQQQAKREAAQEHSELTERIPKLTIETPGADPNSVSLTIDEVQIASPSLGSARRMNPGQHSVVGTYGSQVVTQSVTLAAGEAKTLQLEFAAALPMPPQSAASPNQARTEFSRTRPTHDESSSLQRTLGWAAMGVGGAALVFGGVTRIIAWSKKSDLDADGCHDGHCWEEFRKDVDSYNSLRVPSTIGLVAGVLLAGGGGVLLSTTPSQEEKPNPRVGAWVGLGEVGVQGQF
ncbi:hypothetical protein ACFL5O_11455 [Myxococcota bacterium]